MFGPHDPMQHLKQQYSSTVLCLEGTMEPDVVLSLLFPQSGPLNINVHVPVFSLPSFLGL